MKLNRRNFLKLSVGTTGLVLLNKPKKASANDSPDGQGKGVLVDATKCVGCWWCYAACKHAHNLPETIRPDRENPPKLNSSIWTTLSTKVFGHKLDQDVLSGLAKAIPYILGIYLLLKIMELMAAGEIEMIFTAYPQNLLWWSEIIIGVITPMILFSIPDIRQSRRAVFWIAVIVIAGLALNRFNVTLLALDIRPGYSYFPNWMEIAVSVGLVADALLVVWLAHRFLPIIKQQETTEVKV